MDGFEYLYWIFYGMYVEWFMECALNGLILENLDHAITSVWWKAKLLMHLPLKIMAILETKWKMLGIQ